MPPRAYAELLELIARKRIGNRKSAYAIIALASKLWLISRRANVSKDTGYNALKAARGARDSSEFNSRCRYLVDTSCPV